MLPVLILVVPPTVVGGGYTCWYLGQQSTLSLLSSSSRNSNDPSSFKKLTNDERQQTTGSYIAGIATFATVYGLQSMLFPKDINANTNVIQEGSNSLNNQSGMKSNNTNNSNSNSSKTFIPPHKRKAADQFQPPKSMTEAFQRVGRPILIRSGSAGVAFFFAGVVQTYITMK
jgi:hypothetical protein